MWALYLAAKSLATKRGMKLSRAAARLGADSVTAKRVSLMDTLEVHQDFSTALPYGHSCMSGSHEGYRVWEKAQNLEGNHCVECWTIGTPENGARALIRADTRSFWRAYGPKAGDLIGLLIALGYSESSEYLADVILPRKVLRIKKQEVQATTRFWVGKWLINGKWEERPPSKWEARRPDVRELRSHITTWTVRSIEYVRIYRDGSSDVAGYLDCDGHLSEKEYI